jgi:RNA polymerase sigma factor (sigma-70 family)
MLEQRILEQLFRRNYSDMVHLARVLLGDDGEAEDLVQDIFLRVAAKSIPAKDDRYLLTAVRNACLNRIRQMRIHDKVKGLMPIEAEADLQPIEKRLGQLDEIAVYVDEQLQEPHRTIIHLRFDEDLTISDIARRLGLNQNTTYKYLVQGIERIRQHFKNH